MQFFFYYFSPGAFDHEKAWLFLGHSNQFSVFKTEKMSIAIGRHAYINGQLK